MPIIGLALNPAGDATDEMCTYDLYFTNFEYVKPNWDTDGTFEAGTADNFKTGPWTEFGHSRTGLTLDTYEGTIGGKEGTFLKVNNGAWTRCGFTTSRNSADIVAELTAMKELGYTSIETQVYTSYTNYDISIMLYGAPTGYAIRETVIPANTWMTFTYSIDELLNWYANDQIGLGAGQMPIIGLAISPAGDATDEMCTYDLYFTDFVFVK